ncbi:MAG TPA: hypothetical protein VMO78_17245 [Rhizomicrobium sp.]|nr:hypothetical protein [Rhizomicrobium sp.]
MMAIRFSVARIDEASPVGFTPGWAVVRQEPGEPGKFVSRIFFRVEDAEIHAQRLMMMEVARAAKGH